MNNQIYKSTWPPLKDCKICFCPGDNYFLFKLSSFWYNLINILYGRKKDILCLLRFHSKNGILALLQKQWDALGLNYQCLDSCLSRPDSRPGRDHRWSEAGISARATCIKFAECDPIDRQPAWLSWILEDRTWTQAVILQTWSSCSEKESNTWGAWTAWPRLNWLRGSA